MINVGMGEVKERILDIKFELENMLAILTNYNDDYINEDFEQVLVSLDNYIENGPLGFTLKDKLDYNTNVFLDRIKELGLDDD